MTTHRFSRPTSDAVAAVAATAFVLLALLTAPVATGSTAAAQEAASAEATTPTEVTVRVLARGAKLIGTSVGGARVTIRNAETGAVLAEGEHLGGTGDTGLIMRTVHTRGETVYDTEGAAEFTVTLLLDGPTRVEVEAVGPLDFPQAMVRTVKVLDLEPGVRIGPEGVVLELNGLIVEAERAGVWVDEGPIDLGGAAGDTFPIRARVRMLCSCPIEPGGLWEVERVEARIRDDTGAIVTSVPLEFSGESSVFEGALALGSWAEAVEAGWVLELVASDPPTGNVGRVRLPLSR